MYRAIPLRTSGLEIAYFITGMRFRPKRHQYVAFALVVLGGVIYFARPVAPDTRKWQPLAVPIELKFVKVQTPEFTTSLDTKYRLLVACERRIDFRRLECSLGMVDWPREKACADVPEVIDIRWTLLHNGQFAASGASGDSVGGIYGSDTVEREIGGVWRAKRGEVRLGALHSPVRGRVGRDES